MITEEFHKRLIQLLKDKNISQKKLANGIGVTEATISRYVSGERFPRYELIGKIANFLGVTSDYLLGIEPTESEMEMLRIIKKLLVIYGYIDEEDEDLSMENLRKLLEFYYKNKDLFKK